MRILITGICGLRNKGVEALLRTVIQGIETQYPDSSFDIPTYTPEYDLDVLGPLAKARLLKDPFLGTGHWGVSSTLRKGLAFRIQRRLARSFAADFFRKLIPSDPAKLLPYDVPDLVLVSGGDLYSSDYGHANLKHFLEPILWSHAHGIPCVLFAQSIGIFKNEKDLALWKDAADKVSFITVREPLTQAYLVEETGIDPNKIKLTADTAFLLEADLIAANWLRSVGSDPIVAVSISQGICDWTGQGRDQHFASWVSVIDNILNKWGARVLIVPHVQETYCDDRLISTRIHRAFNFDSRILLAGSDHTAMEFKGMISACDMVIAERMHAAIAGFSSGVPTVPVGYSIKARGITAQLFDETEIKTDSIVISSEGFLDQGKCFPHLDYVWNNRGEIENVLNERLPKVKFLAEENFRYLNRFTKK